MNTDMEAIHRKVEEESGFTTALMEQMGAEMEFMRGLAHEGKIAQGIFVARRC